MPNLPADQQAFQNSKKLQNQCRGAKARRGKQAESKAAPAAAKSDAQSNRTATTVLQEPLASQPQGSLHQQQSQPMQQAAVCVSNASTKLLRGDSCNQELQSQQMDNQSVLQHRSLHSHQQHAAPMHEPPEQATLMQQQHLFAVLQLYYATQQLQPPICSGQRPTQVHPAQTHYATHPPKKLRGRVSIHFVYCRVLKGHWHHSGCGVDSIV